MRPGISGESLPAAAEQRAQDPAAERPPSPHGESEPEAAGPQHAIRIDDPGLFATIQDLGRAGMASRGIARSGALDRGALRTANRLLGNDESAAGVEVTLGGIRATALADTWFAVCGAAAPLELDGRPVDPYASGFWPAGSQLRIGWTVQGVRGYLALSGGVSEVTGGDRDARGPVGGSLSTDTMSGIGPAPLREGDRLVTGAARQPPAVEERAAWAPGPGDVDVVLQPGPRADWFAADALARLFADPWTVTGDADRVGVRLDGPELRRIRHEELDSEGTVPGAIQVPPSGAPTVLLADGPVTGGYPVIAVVSDASLDRLGQVQPGTRIRFRHG